MKRIISILLIITMALTMFSAIGYADDNALISVTLKASDISSLPKGTKVCINAKTDDDNVKTLVLYEELSSGDVLIESVDSKEANFLVEVKTAQRNFYVVAKDADGNIISDEMSLTLAAGYKTNSKKVYWDIDFEDEILSTRSTSGAHTIQSSQGVNLVNPDEKYFGINVSLNTNNTADINDGYKTNSGVISDYGNALELNQTTSDTVQLNQMYCPAPSGTVQIFEMDVYGTVNADSWLLRSNRGSNSKNVLFGNLITGSFYVGTNGTKVELGTTDNWRHVTLIQDVDSKTLAFLVDGVLIDYHEDDAIEGVLATEGDIRFTGRLNGQGSIWYDNFYVYTIKKGEPKVDIKVLAENNQYPQGFMVSANVALEQDDVSEIKVYYGTDENGTLIDTIDGNKGTVKVKITDTLGDIYAVAYDEESNVVGKGNAKIPSGFLADDPHYLYDLDFEDKKVLTSGIGATLVNSDMSVVYADSKDNASISANIGNSENVVTVDKEYITKNPNLTSSGNVLRLTRTTDSEIQLNQIQSPCKTGILVFEMDMYTEIGATDAVGAYLRVNTGNNSNNVLKGDFKSGKFTFGTKSADLGEKDDWRHITFITDIDNKAFYCFVDDVLIGNINDDTISAVERYIIRVNGQGDVYIDNLKIYEINRPPVIDDLSANGNEFTFTLPYGLEKSHIDSFDAFYQRNRLTIKNWTYDEETNLVKVTTYEPIYTCVDVTFTLNYNRYGFEGEVSDVVTLGAKEFDVTSVTRLGTGKNIGISATLVNTSGQNKTAVMVLCTTDACGRVKTLRWSDVTNVTETGATITLEAKNIGDADGARVFFLESHTSLTPIKGVVYKIDG